MKRYLVFFGKDNLSRNGGMEDFLSDHDNFEDAMRAIGTAEKAAPKKFFKFFSSRHWNHVYDTVDKRIVTWK